jgi:hypothetical protein
VAPREPARRVMTIRDQPLRVLALWAVALVVFGSAAFLAAYLYDSGPVAAAGVAGAGVFVGLAAVRVAWGGRRG